MLGGSWGSRWGPASPPAQSAAGRRTWVSDPRESSLVLLSSAQTEQLNSDVLQSGVAACMWKLVTATSSNPCRDEKFSCYSHGQPCCCKGRSRLPVLPVAFTALYLPGNALILG